VFGGKLVEAPAFEAGAVLLEIAHPVLGARRETVRIDLASGAILRVRGTREASSRIGAGRDGKVTAASAFKQ
jgi:hypothetical protein